MKTKLLTGMLLLAAGLFISSCSDDDDYAISMDKIISTVDTGNAEVTAVSAKITGTVKDLSGQSSNAYSVGICYSTNEDPTTGTKVEGAIADDGTVTTTISGLTKGVTYYYCTFVTMQKTLNQYGEVKSFTTTDAQVGTADAASVTAVSANLGGTLNGVSDMITEGSSALTYGIKVSTIDSDVAVKEGKELVATSTTNSYSIGLNGLMPNTTYYYIAYMTLNGGYVYGDMKKFITPDYEMEYVDMGLTVKWASCNLGATSKDELGGLYGWGDVTGLNISTNVNEYGIADNITGTDYDVCSKVDGRMPTFAEISELIKKCNPEWTKVNGVYGCKFTARNGNTIFLPAAGYREGEQNTDADVSGLYWAGSINQNSTDYAYSMSFNNSGAKWSSSLRYQGLSIRPVKDVEVEGVKFDNYKLVTGDIENNGNFRMEIYNAYGSTANACGLGVAPADFAFADQLAITFTVSGISKAGEYKAFLAFADGSWSASNWEYHADGQGSCMINGDGTYTIRFNAASKGLNVFCIDIVGLSAACGGAEGITATINKIVLDDWGTKVTFDNYKLSAGDIESNGNYRMELYNAYGATANACGLGVAPADFAFTKKMAVTFTLKGITKAGEYKSFLAFADGSWANSNWEYHEDGQASCLVTGDGTYTVKFTGAGAGLNVYCVDVVGLSAACGEAASDIVATIDAVRVE